MKKRILFLLFLTLCNALMPSGLRVQSTPPSIQWQLSVGNGEVQLGASVAETSMGYLAFGLANQNLLPVSGNHGQDDMWLVETDFNGNFLSQKCYGGSSWEVGKKILPTPDGGYILIGSTYSNDFDVSGNHGDYDAWIVKIDSSGNIQWQKCIGGSNFDEGNDIVIASNGDYIVTGATSSNDGDVTGNHGNKDLFIARLSSGGTLLWLNCFGSALNDVGNSVVETSSGSICSVGYTDANTAIGGYSYNTYTVFVTSTGTFQWQRTYGGSNYEELRSVCISGNTIVAAGYTSSGNGNILGNHNPGVFDIWVVKMSQTDGTIITQKCYGGQGEDVANHITVSDNGGYLITGHTTSTLGSASMSDLWEPNHGQEDVLVYELDASMNILWNKSLGGTHNDQGYSVKNTTDGGYILTGFSRSSNGDATVNYGKKDMWIVKLHFDGPLWINPGNNNATVIIGDTTEISCYYNSDFQELAIINFEQESVVEIYDYVGRLVCKGNEKIINTSSFVKGTYFLLVITRSGKRNLLKIQIY